jgi:hypothetical protein
LEFIPQEVQKGMQREVKTIFTLNDINPVLIKSLTEEKSLVNKRIPLWSSSKKEGLRGFDS